MQRSVDLNADVGESYGQWSMGDDAAILAVVTSANIACGFHAGDPLTIQRTIRKAVDCGVVIGAHISYHDIIGFGRRAMTIEPEALSADVVYQLAALDGMCATVGTRVRYVKAHGALYHEMNRNPEQAEAVLAGVRGFNPALPMLGAPLGHQRQTTGIARVFREGFADRAYRADGETLVPRTEPGAVLHDSQSVARQALALAERGCDSICLHGDTPEAISHASAVRTALEAQGFVLQPFVAA